MKIEKLKIDNWDRQADPDSYNTNIINKINELIDELRTQEKTILELSELAQMSMKLVKRLLKTLGIKE